MRARLVAYLVSVLLRELDPQLVKEVIDDMLDKVEDASADKPLVLKVIQWVRVAFEIPDDIGGDED